MSYIQKVSIGDKFKKRVGKSKVDCEIVDIVNRVSVKKNKIIETEYWAISNNFGMGKSFQVAKATVVRGRI